MGIQITPFVSCTSKDLHASTNLFLRHPNNTFSFDLPVVLECPWLNEVVRLPLDYMWDVHYMFIHEMDNRSLDSFIGSVFDLRSGHYRTVVVPMLGSCRF